MKQRHGSTGPAARTGPSQRSGGRQPASVLPITHIAGPGVLVAVTNDDERTPMDDRTFPNPTLLHPTPDPDRVRNAAWMIATGHDVCERTLRPLGWLLEQLAPISDRPDRDALVEAMVNTDLTAAFLLDLLDGLDSDESAALLEDVDQPGLYRALERLAITLADAANPVLVWLVDRVLVWLLDRIDRLPARINPRRKR